MLANSSLTTAWKSKDLSKKNTEPSATLNNILNPAIYYNNNSAKIHGKIDESCLNANKVTFTSKAVLSFSIVYKMFIPCC